MKLIGRGAFTKAYLNDSGRVVLKSCCPIKEVMSFGWFPDSPLFPKIVRTDHETYEMGYLEAPKGGLKKNLDKDQFAIYRTLRDLEINIGVNAYDGYARIYSAFETIKDENLREVMLLAVDACANMGSDIGFEISPRNVRAVNGKLVLLDCFFHLGKLKKVRKHGLKNTLQAA